MKAVVFASVVCLLGFTSAQLRCEHKKPNIPDDWLDMEEPCIAKMKSQVQEELQAAMQYLAMGAHFSRDNVNRPGFAKMFFDAASEEREHAIKIIAYLLMRGGLTSEVSTLIQRNIVPKVLEWNSAADALRDALKLEALVTKKIRDIIIACDLEDKQRNDYHLVDYLTGEFLEEQYKGQREIAGRLSTLDKMMDKHGALGEFLYDKKLLNEA